MNLIFKRAIAIILVFTVIFFVNWAFLKFFFNKDVLNPVVKEFKGYVPDFMLESHVEDESGNINSVLDKVEQGTEAVEAPIEESTVGQENVQESNQNVMEPEKEVFFITSGELDSLDKLNILDKLWLYSLINRIKSKDRAIVEKMLNDGITIEELDTIEKILADYLTQKEISKLKNLISGSKIQ